MAGSHLIPSAWRGATRQAKSLASGWGQVLLFVSICMGLNSAHAGGAQPQDEPRRSAPQRIISLAPALTETVCALGACDKLVGVDRFSNYPAQVIALPKVGGLDDTSLEPVINLRPDLVLVESSSRVGERLTAFGLKVVTLRVESLDDARLMLGRVSALLGVADTQALWLRIDAAVNAAASGLPAAAKGMRVYYEVDGAPYAAGESSFVGQTLKRLGARNIIPAALGPFPKINPEFVVRANPDLIMIGQRSADGLYQRPGWDAIAALRNQRVCIFTNEQYDVLARPGPRMAEAAQIMARCLTEMSTNAARGSRP